MAEGGRWAPDPWRRHDLRYWSETEGWTDHVSSRGLQGEDPVPETPPPLGQVAPEAKQRKAGVVLGLGGLAMVVGSFLPWVQASAPFVGSISRSGFDTGDGILVTVLGAVASALGLRVYNARPLSTTGARAQGTILALIAGAILIYNLVQVENRIEEAADVSDNLVAASVGGGLWLACAGAVAVLVGAQLVPQLTTTIPSAGPTRSRMATLASRTRAWAKRRRS